MKIINNLFNSFNGAFAPNTIRAYRSDFGHYADWCKKYQYNPLNIKTEQMVNYVEHLSESLKVATIERRLASLGSIFKLSKSPNPINEPEVILAMKRIKRKLGKIQKQAAPLTFNILNQMLMICDESPKGIRNQVLLRLGYETMRRRSEICRFRFEDIQSLDNKKFVILLRQSKTDQFGIGKRIAISNELYRLIMRWSKLIGESHGYILRSFKRNLRVNASLNPASLNEILKNLQRKSGVLDGEDLSGHSFRVGAALDLLERGESLERIMLRGGWKSDSSAMRYLRNWNECSYYDSPI